MRLRAALQEEPSDKEADAATIVFRLPGLGERVQRRFMKTCQVQILYDFIDSLGPEKLQLEDHGKGYVIMQSMPRKEYNQKEKTLAEVGLHPRAML